MTEVINGCLRASNSLTIRISTKKHDASGAFSVLIAFRKVIKATNLLFKPTVLNNCKWITFHLLYSTRYYGLETWCFSLMKWVRLNPVTPSHNLIIQSKLINYVSCTAFSFLLKSLWISLQGYKALLGKCLYWLPGVLLRASSKQILIKYFAVISL